MNESEIKNKIIDSIRKIAEEQSMVIEQFNEEMHLIDDLGFKSLDIATLMANLENSLNVDPFFDGSFSITDIRTIDDLNNIYIETLKKVKPPN